MIKKDTFFQDLHQTCIFISPHLDDAILSCFEVIKKIKQHNKRVIVITIFSQGNVRTSNSTIEWVLRKTGFTNSETYFQARRKEDRLVLDSLKVDNFSLNFTEALWRNPNVFKEFSNLFQEQFAQDVQLEKEINKELRTFIKNKLKKEQYSLFLPLGIGKHVDHLIVRQACQALSTNEYFWEDIPYSSLKKNDPLTWHKEQYDCLYSQKPTTAKEKILRSYFTQYYSLFPTGNFPEMNEKIWVSKGKLKDTLKASQRSLPS